jgi:hypothetical protein
MSKHKALNELAQRETQLFQQRQSLAFLECAINLLCTDFDLDDVAMILREHAAQLEDYG